MGSGINVQQSTPKIIVTQEEFSDLHIGQGANQFLNLIQDSGDAIHLSATTQSLTIVNSERPSLVINEAAAQILLISETSIGIESSQFGQPYYQAEDPTYYYFSWQHTNGTQWEAQRFDNVSFEIITINGSNPQPQSLIEFQNLSF